VSIKQSCDALGVTTKRIDWCNFVGAIINQAIAFEKERVIGTNIF